MLKSYDVPAALQSILKRKALEDIPVSEVMLERIEKCSPNLLPRLR